MQIMCRKEIFLSGALEQVRATCCDVTTCGCADLRHCIEVTRGRRDRPRDVQTTENDTIEEALENILMQVVTEMHPITQWVYILYSVEWVTGRLRGAYAIGHLALSTAAVRYLRSVVLKLSSLPIHPFPRALPYSTSNPFHQIYLIPTKEVANTLMVRQGLRAFMGGGDHLLR
ncbi:hypothetical protein EVAR_31010_1 [Eumeta japonica]|uniref:Uncharacterized protein n=1 Tax=Eumeta variegata TaxID=151549 RepID=A0A4C1VFE0_EUMVA|nr:hypothetical protein EVAR_31010_1 [Eumeta japonica]